MGTGTGTGMETGPGLGLGLSSASLSPTSAAPCRGKMLSLEAGLKFRAGFNLQHTQMVPEPRWGACFPQN